MQKDRLRTSGSLDRLDPCATALLVIDMQLYFLRPEYPFGQWLRRINPSGVDAYRERVEQIVLPGIQRLQERFRALGAQVVYTELGSLRQDRRDMPGWARRHNALGYQALGSPLYATFDDPSCRVDERVAPVAGELVVQKTTSGPTGSTRLDQTLRVLGIDTVVVTGVLTDVCVAQAARELGDRDFDAIVVDDASAALDRGIHRAALDTIAMTFGRVWSTSQVLERLNA